ncbi:MAG: hypothetical protein AB9846_10810 [Tenuifilaceae bacterium]
MKKSFKVISVILFGVMLLGSLIVTSCKDDDTDDPYAGKTNPSTIATTNLVAYFPFENNGTDEISMITPSNTATTTATFAAGRRGQAFQGATDKNSGLLYTLPTGSKLKTLKTFSVSVWLKQIPNTVATTDAPEQMVFHLDGKGDWIWGNLFLLQHRNWPAGATERERNFAEMDCYFWKDDASAWKGQRGSGWFVDVTAPQWRHIICTYDNVTSTFHSYVNGVHVTAYDGTAYMGVNRWQADGQTTPLGDLKFNTPEKFAIGAWCDRLAGTSLQDDAWASPFKGLIDELRIYDRGLTALEAKALYDAEVTMINP